MQIMCDNKAEIKFSAKQCRCCKRIKSLEEFYVSKTSKDGFRGECKKCTKENTFLYTGVKKRKEQNKYQKLASLYRINKGLTYKAIHGTKYVTYVCLQCGKQHTTSWKLAHDARFKCPTREFKKVNKKAPVLVQRVTKIQNKGTQQVTRKEKLSLWQKIKNFLRG